MANAANAVLCIVLLGEPRAYYSVKIKTNQYILLMALILLNYWSGHVTKIIRKIGHMITHGFKDGAFGSNRLTAVSD